MPADRQLAVSGRGATGTGDGIRPDTHVHCFLAADARIREQREERIRHLEDELDRRANIVSALADALTGAQLKVGLLRAGMQEIASGAPGHRGTLAAELFEATA